VLGLTTISKMTKIANEKTRKTELNKRKNWMKIKKKNENQEKKTDPKRRRRKIDQHLNQSITCSILAERTPKYEQFILITTYSNVSNILDQHETIKT
jgi:hypothetical protein